MEQIESILVWEKNFSWASSIISVEDIEAITNTIKLIASLSCIEEELLLVIYPETRVNLLMIKSKIEFLFRSAKNSYDVAYSQKYIEIKENIESIAKKITEAMLDAKLSVDVILQRKKEELLYKETLHNFVIGLYDLLVGFSYNLFNKNNNTKKEEKYG